MPPLNRTQWLLLGFIVLALAALVIIGQFAPEVYDEQLRPLGLSDVVPRIAFLAVLLTLLAVLVVAIVRRWRWAFWVMLLAMAAGIVRVPAFALQLSGVLPLDVPLWYATLQAFIGVIQVAIAGLMYLGYRRHGVWGAF